MKKEIKIRDIGLQMIDEYTGIGEPTQTAEITEEERKKGHQFFRIGKNRKAILLQEVDMNIGIAEQIVFSERPLKCGIHLMVFKDKVILALNTFDKKRKEETEEMLIKYASQFFEKVKSD